MSFHDWLVERTPQIRRGRLAGRLVALGWTSIAVARNSNYPRPRSASLSRGPRKHHMPNDFAVGRDLVAVPTGRNADLLRG